jgi:hypothetical protein
MRLVNLSERVESIQRVLGLSSEDLAYVIEADPRTVQRWLRNENFPQGKYDERLTQLYEIVKRLLETFSTPEAVHRWMNTETRDLAGLRPVEVVRARRLDRVIGALEAIASGDFA